jgi:hypothetical protein
MAKTIKTQAKEVVSKLCAERNQDLKTQMNRLIAVMSKAENNEDAAFVIALAKQYNGKEGYHYVSYTSIQFKLVFEVTSFKKGLVPRLLSKCLDLTDTGNYDYASEYRAERTYSFKFPSGNSLSIECNLKADGPTCRRVQIGVETTTTPIYKIQC